MTKTIKELFNLVGSPFLFDPDTAGYPTFEDSNANFITDYNTYKEEFDRYFIREYGKHLVDLDAENNDDAAEEWKEEVASILRIYLQSWARLYYALDISFNPIYNVEEHTTTTYGEHVTGTEYGEEEINDVYGARQRQDIYPAKEQTNGQRTDGTTAFSVSYDNATEKETGRTSDVIGSQTITEAAHTDTHTEAIASDKHTKEAKEDVTTSGEHIDQVDRFGNIGVVSATDLLINEEKFRRKYSFFKNCFLTIITEVGAYYERIII